MSNTVISLCLSYPNRNNPSQINLFRVADYDPEYDILYPVDFNSEKYAGTPWRIGANPKDLYINMTTLRAWKHDSEDPSKTRSNDFGAPVYEVVFPVELKDVDYSDVKTIRRVLCEGFSLADNVTDKFFLQIGKNNTHISVLLCQKKDLKRLNDGRYAILSDTRDMLHSVHTLNEYDILSYEIIDTSGISIFLPDGKKAPVRYFYKSTELPDRIGVFHPIGFSKYIPSFISNYIKKNKNIFQFSLNDIKKFTDILDSVLEDEEYISDFFDATGFSKEQLEELLPKYNAILVENLLGDSFIDDILRRYLDQSPEMHSRYLNIAKDIWISEKCEEKDHILKELETLKSQHLEYQAIIHKEEQSKKFLLSEIQKLNDEAIESQKTLKKIQKDIEAELKEFSNNIVHNTAVYAIANSNNVSHDKSDIKLFNLIPNVNEEVESLSSYDDFQESLADNFISIGYKDAVADQMAQLISYCISAKTPILLNTNEDKISQCIAAMFDSYVSLINIGANMSSQEYLYTIENNCNSKVLLINGAFNSFSTEHFDEITYLSKQKGFIPLFSVNSAEISMISQHVHNKSMYLECGEGFDYSQDSMLQSFVTADSVFEKTYAKEDYIKQKKALKPFIDIGIINTVTAANYIKFMIDIECNLEKDWIVLLQLCIQSKSSNKSDEFKELLNSKNIDIEIINKYM